MGNHKAFFKNPITMVMLDKHKYSKLIMQKIQNTKGEH